MAPEVLSLRGAGVDVPNPKQLEGFDTLPFVSLRDPDGNTIGLRDRADRIERTAVKGPKLAKRRLWQSG